ncbi:hypothetical protein TOPH_09170, partial [Tolypocladium ophioglossoides CBS 100239]
RWARASTADRAALWLPRRLLTDRPGGPFSNGPPDGAVAVGRSSHVIIPLGCCSREMADEAYEYALVFGSAAAAAAAAAAQRQRRGAGCEACGNSQLADTRRETRRLTTLESWTPITYIAPSRPPSSHSSPAYPRRLCPRRQVEIQGTPSQPMVSSAGYIMDPPPGQVRTPVGPPSSGGAVMPTGIAMTAVAGVLVALRLYARVRVVPRDLGWDDGLVLCALAFSVGFLCVGRHLYTVGAGLHIWDVPESDFGAAFLQTTIAAFLTYAISVSFSKLSMLAFYLRLSPRLAFRRTVYAFVGVVCAHILAYVLVLVFRCRPVAAGWGPAVEGAQCIDSLPPTMVLIIASVVIDFVILCLPIPVIEPLQMPLRQKIALALLFATGGGVIAAAIRRTIILPNLLASPDYTWNLSQQFIWSFVEINASLICASAAALKPLFMRYVPFLLGPRLRSSPDHRRSAGKASRDTGSDAGNNAGSDSGALYGEAYELPSRDELPIQRPGADDEEAQLWSRRNLYLGRAASSQNSARKHSLDSLGLGDLYPGARAPVSAVSATGYALHASESTEGIKVTKETFVSYGKI